MDWDEMARPWLEAAPGLEAAHKPVLDALILAAQLRRGERVLDVGCGTGPSLLAAAEAVGPAGHITGIDIAPPLLSRAKERVPAHVGLVAGDAGSYPYAGKPFDIVLSNFGIMFFEDTAKALAHLRDAVRPGARLAASVWGGPMKNPWFTMPRSILDGLLPDLPRPDPAGPGPLRFGDPSPLVAALKTAGWRPHIDTVDLLLTPPGSASDVAAIHMKVTAGMMLRGVDVTEDQLAEIAAALIEACREQEVDGVVRVPAEIHIVTADAV